jgi:Spy/CpxP family protein refolding chaperone
MRRAASMAPVALGAAALLLSSPAWAEELSGPGGPGPGGGGGWTGGLKALDLSVDQVRRIAELRADMVAKVAPLRAQLEVKRVELHALWLADQPSRQAILAKQREADGVRTKIRTASTDFRLAVLGVLTAEQRTRLQTLMRERPAWGRGGPGRGWGRGRGPGRGRRGGL